MGARTDLPQLRSGQVLSHSDLNRIADAVIRKITAGPGIALTHMGDRIVVSLLDTRKGGVGGVGGIGWGGELAAHPTLPTGKPLIYYNTVNDALWIGYNGSGSSDVWTSLQVTTIISGGAGT